ncbi:MAG TPA: nuclear transport factor 2 family protein [Casimicrobiaceae bacterium]|nr:nuclear transport factor 2 family protein [Casimicrobiaceae bacterium]
MPFRLSLALLTACVAAAAIAQPAPQTTSVPTVTRLVKMFSDLERRLVEKTHAKDASALDALLDPSFEMRIGSAPGVPVPRDAWIRDARKSAAAPRIEQMAVHDFGDLAVVSFREASAASGARRRGHDRFVVDCWRRDGETWKLVVRYVSDASASDVAGTGTTIDKRY